ncbi:Protein CBG04844 [Caenorhabditis briggsae]|uniref:Protein CBG04844 n=1 Tax=Caenorhabditis briggsae TaxID=6238 RepID=A8WYL8_CAEBR|nr:Protein CBG04844 [Caenorhabditis briggsae]CAP25476.1 Protein CBG04844 [Caenorhabditis briggsae]
MSSEKLLNEMPVVLSAVMDPLDFRSIMMMRKVCHDFRVFIDKVAPSSSKTKILLTVRPYDVELILEDSETEVRYDKILLNHQSLKSFTLQYESRYESEELKCWFEILFDGIIRERTWYKRIPGTEDNFLVMIPHYASEFIMQSKMSSEKSLNEMPGVVLSAVMDHLDFRSILRMRKVCHDLRNFIDEVVPSSYMTRIIVTVRPYDVELILEDSKTGARYTTIYAHRNAQSGRSGCRSIRGFTAISLEFLRHLIEVLLNNQSLKFFSLEYETYYESEELKSWFEILFDGNRPHNSHHQIWYSIIPGSERNFLEMEAVHTITMVKCSQTHFG